ncbi:MAG: chorismate mutase [Candidatus Levybacteria bacterium]|nr:chorismate mutase [Candidatus Levybacteria bacterium]
MADLDTYRKQIDEIDSNLLELIAKRLEIVQMVGEYKKQNNLPVIDRSREEALLTILEEKGKKYNISRDLIEGIWKQLFNAAYKLEE